MSLFAEFEPDVDGRSLPESANVRLAISDDAWAIAQLWAQRNDRDAVAAQSGIQAELEKNVRGGTALVFVASVAGDLVGYGRLRLFRPPNVGAPGAVPEGWYLMGVVVNRDWRRCGLGAVLTQARLDAAAERTDRVHYFVSAQNRASIALHAAFGFREVARDIVVPPVTFTGGVGVLFERRFDPERSTERLSR